MTMLHGLVRRTCEWSERVLQELARASGTAGQTHWDGSWTRILQDRLSPERAARLGEALASAAELLALDRWSSHGIGTPGQERPVSKRVVIQRDLDEVIHPPTIVGI